MPTEKYVISKTGFFYKVADNLEHNTPSLSPSNLPSRDATVIKKLAEFRPKYIKENGEEQTNIMEKEEFVVDGIVKGGLVDSVISKPNNTGKVLYEDLVEQISSGEKVTRIPYVTSYEDCNNNKIPTGDVHVFEELNKNTSPEVISKVGENFVNKMKLTHEDWAILLSDLPQQSLSLIMFPACPADIYRFLNLFAYSTLAEGDNNLTSSNPSQVAWAKGFASLAMMAYKLSHKNLNLDLTSYNVLADQYSICCQHTILTLRTKLLPGIEQTYSVKKNCFMPVYDLLCMQNFNNHVMNNCLPCVKTRIIEGLLTPGYIFDTRYVDILKIFVRSQDLRGLELLQHAHLNLSKYPNTICIMSHTEHHSLKCLEVLIQNQITDLKINKLLPAADMIVANCNTFNYLSLAQWWG